MAQPTIQQLFGQAVQHHQAGKLPEAEQLYRQVLTQYPEHVAAIHYLGMIAFRSGRYGDAVDLIRRALALQPNYVPAHNDLGIVLKDMGQLDEAIAVWRQVIALKPDSPEIYNNLGNALKERGQLDEAIASYHHALALRSDYAQAHCNLAGALADNGQLDDAIAAYRQALSLQPDYCQAHGNLIFSLNYHPAYDAKTIAEEYRRWNRQYAQPLRPLNGPDHLNDRSPDRRLRIGYVSADFHAHACAHFLVPLLEHHDPQQVELFCYAQVVRPDAITRRMQQAVPHWQSTVGLSDEQLAKQIRADQIDILVDLKLHSSDNRLLVFARKPAPVQVTWLGYPGSTGLSAIDYRLSDPYLDPLGVDESVYSEKTIRLPETFWCYDPLGGREISVAPLPALQTGIITFGCLNNFCKINHTVLQLWARVLGQVENSRLLLLSPPGSHRQRTIDQLHCEGIDPKRIEFVPRQGCRAYLETYHQIDVGLDSFPYNGHTTSLDSTWMGVPVVTLVGQTVVSRAGWCQLSNLGLSELAAHSPEQFVHIVVNLAKDLPRLRELRSTLRQRMEQSPLMDAAKFARNMEAAYRQMWRGK